MALRMIPASLSFPSHHSPQLFTTPPVSYSSSSFQIFVRSPKNLHAARASSSSDQGDGTATERNTGSKLLSNELLRRVSGAKDADQALELIAEEQGADGCGGGVVGASDCSSIIEAALDRNNADLAFSVFSAMSSSFRQGAREMGSAVERWKWARPDLHTYRLLIRGLAASLRVSDAIRMINYVSQVGVSSGEEVPFGKIVRCPTCMIAIAVAQPQHGSQVASCSRCRYQYELFSGEIVNIVSEEISMEISAWEKGLRFLQIMNRSVPAAIHSIVVRTPTGTARTHRFATKTVELPAQEGERVTISLAASSSFSRGPIKFNARPPEFSPGEPMRLTNHTTGQESELLRAPTKDRNSFLLNPAFLFPAVTLLATGDAASGIIDPSLPRFISIVAVASFALGTTFSRVILPQLNQLPRRMMDVVALKQQLLSQYDMLQGRIKDLIQAAEKEVWMLARMSQLENKILAVGEPSYRARRSRVKSVSVSLENSLMARIELIESYAKISSMIEIEVEMDSDVLAAEAVSNAESIAEQIEQAMEIESLQEQWRIQAEANDEVERLLRSQPTSTEHV